MAHFFVVTETHIKKSSIAQAVELRRFICSFAGWFRSMARRRRGARDDAGCRRLADARRGT